MMSTRRAVAIGLMLAGIVHVVTILAVPATAPMNAFQRAAALAPVGRTVVPDGAGFLPGLDPAFVHGLCRLEPGAGVARLAGRLPETLWTLAVIDMTGATTEAFSHAAVAGSDLELDVAAGAVVEQIRVERAAMERSTIYAAVETAEAIVLVRVFAETAAERPAITARLEALSCGPASD